MQLRQCHDVGVRRFIEKDRKLAKKITSSEPRPLFAIDMNRCLTLQDDVEADAGKTLAYDALVLAEPRLVEAMRYRLELRA